MRRILIIAALFLLPVINLIAQQPVQVTPQLVAPYTLQVSEYYSPGASGAKLNLLLLLRDFNKPTLQVRLRMSISSQTVSITTKENVAFTPITIYSGEPRYVDPSELAQYFNANNLTFSGITQTQYEQTGKLPEGFYTFCFEVVEVPTGQTVSEKGCAIAWLTLNEPPLLNIPGKGESLIPVSSTIQNVLFQWTPRHTASPTAYSTDYIFSIIEIPLNDTTTAPEAAFMSYPATFEDSTHLTTYLFDNLKPLMLQEGYRYAWRVQAKAKNGTQELAMFRNNGYSETFWFTYKSTCPKPSGIGADAQGQRVNVSWLNDVQHLDYKVEYREKGNAEAAWFELTNTIPRVSITDLKDSTIYEYRVGGACEYGTYVFSPIHEFTTRSATATTVPECGYDPNPQPTTEPLLQEMSPGDTIKAGDFDVIAIKVNGAGNFSGHGFVTVPWLAKMKLGVKFENIQVATDKKLKYGEIITTYDPTEDGIADVDETLDLVGDIIKEIADLVRISIDKDYKEIKELIDKIKVEVREQMPDSLFTQYEATLNTLDSAKLAYDNLKNIYGTVTNDAEKEAAFAEMRQAEKSFTDAQDRLNELNKEKEKIIADVVDILIQSAKKLRSEQFADDKIAQLKATMEQKKLALDELVNQTKQNIQGYTPVPASDSVENVGSVISVITLEDDVENVEGQPAYDYKKAELDYNAAVAVKAFSSTDNKVESYKLILQYLRTGDENYVAYVTRKLQDGVPKETLITETKAILLGFITQLLEGEINISK